MMKIINEFHSQILSPNNKVTACRSGLHQSRNPVWRGESEIGPRAWPQALSDSSWPCCDVMLVKRQLHWVPFDCGTGNETLQAPLGKQFATWGFFPPKTFILRSSSFICFNDITWLMEFPEVLQRFTLVILCVDYPLQLFLLYCRCTLRLFLVYLNSCIYKGGVV